MQAEPHASVRQIPAEQQLISLSSSTERPGQEAADLSAQTKPAHRVSPLNPASSLLQKVCLPGNALLQVFGSIS